MYFFFKTKLLVIWVGYFEMAYAFVDSQCINGTYKTSNISTGKPNVELRVLNKNIYVDDETIFTCSVRANPSAEIFWFYEGKFITNEFQRAMYRYSECNKTLTIIHAEGGDTGRYACMARNSHGETTSETITLAVQQKPKFEKNYKSASIETIPSRLCNLEHKNITLKCQHNDSSGICIWKKSNNSLNEEKISYCDDIMCCLTISNYSNEDAGLYTCFMYVNVFKAEVHIPQPSGHGCNKENMKEKNNEECCVGQASKNRMHIGGWLYGILGLIMLCL